jgi:tRNA nucleotidyltransferase (CCA-adding enzyme)
METHPSRFFESLHRCGALAQVLPEVDALLSGGVRGAGGRIMRALERSAAAGDALGVRYAILAGNLDAKSPARAARLAERLNAHLRAPAECRDIAVLTAKHLRRIERAATLSAAALLDVLLATDAVRRPSRLDQLLRVCAAFASMRRGGVAAGCAPAERLRAALELVRGVNAAALARSVKASEMPPRLRALRLKALRDGLAPRRRRQK